MPLWAAERLAFAIERRVKQGHEIASLLRQHVAEFEPYNRSSAFLRLDPSKKFRD